MIHNMEDELVLSLSWTWVLSIERVRCMVVWLTYVCTNTFLDWRYFMLSFSKGCEKQEMRLRQLCVVHGIGYRSHCVLREVHNVSCVPVEALAWPWSLHHQKIRWFICLIKYNQSFIAKETKSNSTASLWPSASGPDIIHRVIVGSDRALFTGQLLSTCSWSHLLHSQACVRTCPRVRLCPCSGSHWFHPDWINQ